jgi:hypothetical protein
MSDNKLLKKRTTTLCLLISHVTINVYKIHYAYNNSGYRFRSAVHFRMRYVCVMQERIRENKTKKIRAR